MVSDFIICSRYCNINNFFLNFHAWESAIQGTHHTLYCITEKFLYFCKCFLRFYICFMFGNICQLWCGHILAHTNMSKFNAWNKAIIVTFTDKQVTRWSGPPSLTMINTGFSAECPLLLKYLCTMPVISVLWHIGDDSCDMLSLQHMVFLCRKILQLTLVFPQKWNRGYNTLSMKVVIQC